MYKSVKSRRVRSVSLFCLFAAGVFVFAYPVSNLEAKLKKSDASSVANDVKSPKSDITRVTPQGVEFVYVNPSAQNVFVAGNFNEWNPSRDALSKDKKGVWRLVLPLKPGHHQYKFVVDGAWLADPTNTTTADDGFGGVNSVIEVKSAPTATSSKSKVTCAVSGGVKFVYKNPSAQKVYVAGSFNSWNTQSDPLIKDGDTWTLIKKLPKGVYQYKFVVDGAWTPDTANPVSSDDGYGGKNSVVEVQ